MAVFFTIRGKAPWRQGPGRLQPRALRGVAVNRRTIMWDMCSAGLGGGVVVRPSWTGQAVSEVVAGSGCTGHEYGLAGTQGFVGGQGGAERA